MVDAHIARVHWSSTQSALALTLLLGLLLGYSTSAQALCPAYYPIVDTLTCSSEATGTMLSSASSFLNYYTCGSPYAPLNQPYGEEIYAFECQTSGSVTMEVTDLTCDMDIYILDDTCNGASGCVAGSTNSSTTSDSVTFSCIAGQTYYIVIEGYGFTPAAAGGCGSEGSYTFEFDVTASTGCPEDCDNGLDDDMDGAIDCYDTDCVGEPSCDCDGDGDGWDGATYGGWCGGTDCNDYDPAISPGATEVCNGIDDDCDLLVDDADPTLDISTGDITYRDNDGDTFGDPLSAVYSCVPPSGFVDDDTDCNDGNPNIYPGAPEYCNGVDDDCDGLADEAPVVDGIDWYADADGDTYGDVASLQNECSAPSGYILNSADCDDTNASIYPGAPEFCNGIDDNCDGVVDDAPVVDGSDWFDDADGDTYGDPATIENECDAPSGYISDHTDCDDSNASIYPGAPEYCNGLDDDCDGVVDDAPVVDGSDWYSDLDADGYGGLLSVVNECDAPSGFIADGSDCNDLDASIYPGAPEYCNGVDDDCDGVADEAPVVDGVDWYADADGDTYGDVTSLQNECSAPSGYILNSADCDDTNANIYPGAPELCNGLDDNCDGDVDDAPVVDGLDWYADLDADSYGGPLSVVNECAAPSGYIADGTDCNDLNADIYPGAPEYCNGLDDDCDGVADEAPVVDGVDWYADADGDTYGDIATLQNECFAPSGYIPNSADCDDTNASIYPGAPEFCNGIDDNCDGVVDDAPVVDGSDWFDDADGDTYGDPATIENECDAPSGYISDHTDCDDSNASIYPGAPEYCNGLDDNCDGVADDAPVVDGSDWYSDLDADSYGGPLSVVNECDAPSGFIADGSDCNDLDASIYPGAPEYCNGVDDDCDGVADEAPVVDGIDWYADADGDTYGDIATLQNECSAPVGYIWDDTDCDDDDLAVNPAAQEVCDGIDNDCDGLIDGDDLSLDTSTAQIWYADADADGYGNPLAPLEACDPPAGYVSDDSDCDDTDPTVNLGSSEIPYDGIDQDCDGSDLTDVDGDGYDAEVVGGLDCDDTDATTNPSASESADGVDEDCDDLLDEGTDWYDDDGDGFTEDGGDCDDAEPLVNPAEREICDGIDEDCDEIIDEETECFDDDGDGTSEIDGDCDDTNADIGPSAVEIMGNGIDDDCDGVVDNYAIDMDSDGYTTVGDDCDDTDATIHPGAVELENGIDDDCDGIVDEGTDAYDDDGDGYSENDGDCDDNDASTSPSAPEQFGNGVDDDCDGTVDEESEVTDDDDDGFSEVGGDCDDDDASVHPGAPEIENGLDDDCDGLVDEGLTDLDNDGYSAAEGDCDDANGWVYPGAPEWCDGVDNGCDGVVDEGCEVDEVYFEEAPGCGCETALNMSHWWFAFALFGLTMTRRRDREE